jgi:hypothetical protein
MVSCFDSPLLNVLPSYAEPLSCLFRSCQLSTTQNGRSTSGTARLDLTTGRPSMPSPSSR